MNKDDIKLIRSTAEIFNPDDPDCPTANKLLALADRMEAQGKRDATCWVHAKKGEADISWGSEKPKTVAKLNWFPLFDYPPDAQARIAELEAEVADYSKIVDQMILDACEYAEEIVNLESQLAEYKADVERLLTKLTNLSDAYDRHITGYPLNGELAYQIALEARAAIAKGNPMTTNKQIEELIAQLDLHSNYDEAVVCPRCIPITAMEASEALRLQQKLNEELESDLKQTREIVMQEAKLANEAEAKLSAIRQVVERLIMNAVFVDETFTAVNRKELRGLQAILDTVKDAPAQQPEQGEK